MCVCQLGGWADPQVRAECQKVCQMRLFHTGASKPLKLEEYDQTQQQATFQVQTYLKETWVPCLRDSIRAALAHVSKGWFCLEETNHEVYAGSKLKKLMELTKYAMQVYMCNYMYVLDINYMCF